MEQRITLVSQETHRSGQRVNLVGFPDTTSILCLWRFHLNHQHPFDNESASDGGPVGVCASAVASISPVVFLRIQAMALSIPGLVTGKASQHSRAPVVVLMIA